MNAKLIPMVVNYNGRILTEGEFITKEMKMNIMKVINPTKYHEFRSCWLASTKKNIDNIYMTVNVKMGRVEGFITENHPSIQTCDIMYRPMMEETNMSYGEIHNKLKDKIKKNKRVYFGTDSKITNTNGICEFEPVEYKGIVISISHVLATVLYFNSSERDKDRHILEPTYHESISNPIDVIGLVFLENKVLK